jgi:hypothetical protein
VFGLMNDAQMIAAECARSGDCDAWFQARSLC